MEKLDSKLRDITFMSIKNGVPVVVHTALARIVATKLEADDAIETYETNVPLENIDERIHATGIRPAYLEMQWTSDFLIQRYSGAREVIEVADALALEKKSFLEGLEISRRYWNAMGVNKWGIFVVQKEAGAW